MNWIPIDTTFNLSWRKIIIAILLFLFLLLLINQLIFYKWSWIIFIRVLIVGIILFIFIYKIIQELLKRYNIKMNVVLIEKLYNKLMAIYLMTILYKKIDEDMDRIYLPKIHRKRKNIIYENKVFKYLLIFFILGYLINNIFFINYNLTIIWNTFFLIFGVYTLYTAYLDKKYILPNFVEFRKSNSLFDSDGPYGSGAPWMTRLYPTAKGLGVVGKVCFGCVVYILGANWGYQSLHPNRKPPVEQIGDFLEGNDWYKEKLDKYTPVRIEPKSGKE